MGSWVYPDSTGLIPGIVTTESEYKGEILIYQRNPPNANAGYHNINRKTCRNAPRYATAELY